MTRCIVHFARESKGWPALVLGLNDKDRLAVDAAINEGKSVVVQDYAWNPSAPRWVTINAKLVTYVEEIGTL